MEVSEMHDLSKMLWDRMYGTLGQVENKGGNQNNHGLK